MDYDHGHGVVFDLVDDAVTARFRASPERRSLGEPEPALGLLVRDGPQGAVGLLELVLGDGEPVLEVFQLGGADDRGRGLAVVGDDVLVA